MNTKTKYEEFVGKQMQDPEFRAYYILAKEKAKLEFMLADLQDTIKSNFNKKVILKRVRSIDNYISKIGMLY